MKCEEVQHRILAGERKAPDVRAHIERCPECRSFLDIVRAVEAVRTPPTEPPPDLDAVILDTAHARLRKPGRPGLLLLRVLAPAAAAAVLAAAGIVWLLAPGRARREPTIAAVHRPAVPTADSAPAPVDDAVIDDALLMLQAEMTALNQNRSESTTRGNDEARRVEGRSSTIDDTLLRLDAEIFLLQEQLDQPPETPGAAPNADASENIGAAPA